MEAPDYSRLGDDGLPLSMDSGTKSQENTSKRMLSCASSRPLNQSFSAHFHVYFFMLLGG